MKLTDRFPCTRERAIDFVRPPNGQWIPIAILVREAAEKPGCENALTIRAACGCDVCFTSRCVGFAAFRRVFLVSCWNPGPLAQRLEHPTHNRLVAGSNPAGATILSSNIRKPGLLLQRGNNLVLPVPLFRHVRFLVRASECQPPSLSLNFPWTSFWVLDQILRVTAAEKFW